MKALLKFGNNSADFGNITTVACPPKLLCNMEPRKYYRIFAIDQDGAFRVFETEQFGDPNNWFENEVEAETFIKDNFIDANSNPTVTLAIIPVFTVNKK